jgi:hypothetical protein
MEDWTTKTDDQLFTGASEQPGSQASYWRDVEIRRRHFLIDSKVAAVQMDAAKAQVEAAVAAKDTAMWTKRSAIAIAASVIIMALGVLWDISGL